MSYKKNDRSKYVALDNNNNVLAYEDSLKAIAIELGKKEDTIRNKYAYDRKKKKRRWRKYEVLKVE